MALLTMTPGPLLFERFGHTALRVDDRVYNFGTFDGGDPHLVRKFLGRKLEYWLSVDSWRGHLARYDNRIITVQVLALSDDEATSLARALEENARPENRAYLYDFFFDNCATRVRDAIDRATGGDLSRGARTKPGRRTLRRHVEAVLGEGALADGVSLLLNDSVDGATTRWDDAFLPEELEAIVAGARRSDGGSLVAREERIVGARYAPAPPGSRSFEWTAASVVVLLLLVGVATPRARAAAGIALVLLGLVGGLLGTALLVAALTPHPCARGNASLVALSPALFSLVPVGVRLARNRIRHAAAVLALLALPCAIDLAAHAVGLARQEHVGLVAATLAVYALAAAAITRARSASAGKRDPARRTFG